MNDEVNTHNWRHLIRFFPTLLTLLVLFSCTTTPFTTDSISALPPDWLSTPFDPEAQDVLLVAYGGTEEHAREDLALQVIQVLLYRHHASQAVISAETAAVIEETARERSMALTPEQRYTEPEQEVSTAARTYYLFRYSAELIAEDLARIAPATVVRPTATPEPPQTRQERPPHSTLRQIEALLTQPVPEDEGGQIRTLEQALNLASRLFVTAAPGEFSLVLGAPRTGELTVTLRDETAPSESPPEQMEGIITLPEIDGHREILRVRSISPAGNDQYRLALPEIRSAGLARLEVGPSWFFQARDRWNTAAGTGRPQELLRAITARLAPQVVIQVSSRARAIPTAIILVDTDIAGNPIANRDATRGAHQQFTEMGFLVHQPEIAPTLQLELSRRGSLDVSDLYDLLPFEVLAGVERVIVGTAGISEFTEDDGFSVRVVLVASAFDLRRDTQLAEIRLEERVSGADSRTILRTAFLSAGRRAARRLAPRLP